MDPSERGDSWILVVGVGWSVIWPLRADSESVHRECRDSVSCYSRGCPLFAWVILEGSNLSQELLIDLSQLFLLLENVLVIENHLFPFAVWLHLLLLHLLSHLMEHLKELIFLLLWGLDAGDGLLSRWEAWSLMVCGCSLVGGRTVPPADSIDLSLVVVPLMTCLFGAIIAAKEAFLR